jgi:hypothetical protein
MEAFAIKNYVFHNLTDILLKVGKIYPEIFTDEIVADELNALKNYIHTITFLGDNISEDNMQTEPTNTNTKNGKDKTTSKKKKFNNEIAPVVETHIPPSLKLSYTPSGCDNETFEVVLGCKRILDPTVPVTKPLDLQHIFKEVIPDTCDSSIPNSIDNRCAARVLTNPKECVATDIMHIDSISKTPIYGRQCKNIKSGTDSNFCSIHKRSNPYGIFREEPTTEIKQMFEKKYKRACDTTL